MTASRQHLINQTKWLMSNNLQVGDEVKVIGSCLSYANGWTALWFKGMDSYIGGTYRINDIFDNGSDVGIYLSCGFNFPYFLLEPVEESKKTHSFVTGEPVLYRDEIGEQWCYGLFSHITEDNRDYKFNVAGRHWRSCIPYEPNKELVGTTNEPQGA